MLTSKTESTTFDIIIVGAGIVGLTLASALADSDLKIAIIDKNALPIAEAPTSNLRVSAITPIVRDIFQHLAIWQTLPSEKISIFKNMHVWIAGGNAIDFSNVEIKQPDLGYIIENHLLHAALYHHVKTYKNVTFLAPLNIKAITTDKNNNGSKVAELITNQGELSAQLIVGADGAHSVVRELCQLTTTVKDYQQTSIIATVTTERPHQMTAWQCFLPTGPLAFLPLKDPHQCSIVWSTTPGDAITLMQKNAADFCLSLQQAFAQRLGQIQAVSERQSFPLQHRHVKHYVKENIALIGDAAHTIHPLAGQGLNLGVLDAYYLAKIILTAKAKQRALGAWPVLRQYERARKADNSMMFAVVDSLKYLFNSQNTALQWIVNNGFAMVNKVDFIKQFLIKQATGARAEEIL